MDQDDTKLLVDLKEKIKICPKCKGIGYLPGSDNQVIKCECYDAYEKTLKYILANIPRVYWKFKLEQYVGNHGATGKVKSYISTIPMAKRTGVGLLFYGTQGTGKTALLSCVMRGIVERGHTAQYTLLAKLFRAFMDKDYEFLEKIHSTDFLCIDDMDKAHVSANTNWFETLVDEVFRYRFTRKKPMIVSYSGSLEQLGQDFGVKLSSLLNECLIPVLIVGDDYRKKVIAKTLPFKLKEK